MIMEYFQLFTLIWVACPNINSEIPKLPAELHFSG